MARAMSMLTTELALSATLLPHGVAGISFHCAQHNNSAEHDIILESYAKINCRLEIPHKNYIAHCNTVPNNTTIANASSKIKSVSGYDPF